ncbi:MAG: SsrA-binding protein SmpB [Rhodothermales bacterium]
MADGIKIVAKNRKARYEYAIDDTLEAGIVLQGSEVKSIREGRISLQEAFCRVENGEMKLFNCHIAPYSHGDAATAPDATRTRKLLLHQSEIRKWEKASQQQGYTIIPLMVYFRNGYAKIEIGLAKGKKLHDKRADVAEKEAKRRMEQLSRQNY